MDKNKEHLDNLSEIRSLMERSSSFLSLSGLSGISAGIIGLITSVYVYSKLSVLFEHNRENSSEPGNTILFFILFAGIVLIVTFALVIFFTARKARKKALPVWDGSAKRLVVNLFIPLVTGGLFCLILAHHYLFEFIAPSMLLFFGLALLNAGKYTFGEIKVLGISEIILGLVSMYWTSLGLLFWAIGFGLLNIIYGVYMYVKYER